MIFAVSFTACQEDFEPGDAGAKTLSGDWVVNYYLEDDNGDLVNSYGPYTVQVYNTSMDEDKIWIENIWNDGIKVKIDKDSETTFSVTDGADVAGHFDGTIDISEAMVIGNDSIIYHVVMTNTDGSNEDDYYAAGTRYTGW
ncbi:lipid-binding protein [Saccharicrinis sp. 156]|uniref:lipid-binding protein n=1 Tax=Saccharicrinis sp. 156 TaxID=3417574 RepID=UPI003D326BB0